MQPLTLVIIAILCGTAMYFVASRRAVSLVEHRRSLSALPGHYGADSLLWVLIPVLAL